MGSVTKNTKDQNRIILLDIGGKLFKTKAQTLQKIPNTKLAQLAEVKEKDLSYDEKSDSYFFERNPTLIPWLLDGYRTGNFHIPLNLCTEFITQELEFWQISNTLLAPCCRLAFNHRTEGGWGASEIDTYLGLSPIGEENKAFCKERLTWRQKAYQFLEDPTYSKGAKIWAITFLGFVLLSVTIQCGMTLPKWRVDVSPRANLSDVTNPKMIMFLTSQLHPVVLYLDLICIGVFTVELLARFLLSSEKFLFIKSIYNIIDIMSLLPMSLSYIMDAVYPEFWGNETLFLFVYILAALGVFRVLRLLKFARNYLGMRVLLLSLQESMREILLLMLLIAIGTLIFSNLIYFAEFHQEDDFHNIPIGFWWAIVTMTTVGYGDKHPVSVSGYIIGACCAVSGMLCTGLPIPIIASNFNMFYTYAKTRQRTEAIQKKGNGEGTKGCLSKCRVSLTPKPMQPVVLPTPATYRRNSNHQ